MAKTRGGFSADRLLAVAFVLMVTVALAGIVSKDTSASFTGSSANPSNHLQTILVQPPATQNATTSGAAGVVNLSWAASPTAPGAGHTLTYLVFRGPVGGPYAQIGSTASLAYSDTPPSDGTYEYLIQTQVTGGGSFTSGGSVAKQAISDRVAPTMSITCDSGSCAGWFNAAVSVTVTGADGGTGMGSVTRNVDSAGQVSTAGASVTFSVTGQSAAHTVAYFGTDAAGNASATTSQTVKIDLTAPTAASSVTGVSGAWGGAATFDVDWNAASDALSGVQGYEVRWTNAVSSCPTTGTTNYPNAATVLGGATVYTVTGTANSSYCAYVVTLDNAGNHSANSGRTALTQAR